ncbi:MAG: hypothetical protein AB7V44_28220 [Pseudonocardia sp.]
MRAVGGRTVADWFLLIRVAVAGLTGGLAAVAVLWVIKDGIARPTLVLLLVVLVALLILFAFAALLSDRHGPTRPDNGAPAAPHPDWPGRTPLAHDGYPPDPAARSAPPALPTTHPPLPEFTPPPPLPERRASRFSLEEHPVPAAQPSGAAVRRIVQCPRCGDFRVQLGRQTETFSFACRRCAHAWEWTPGSPWPATVVRPPGAERGLPTGPTTPRRYP